jgi:tetratricopeptide (TPR) repeat protein
MTPALVALVACLLAWLAQAPATQSPPVSADEEALRTAVQQYYDAQAARDADRTLTFWSASANPRPGRDAYLAVFGEPAEDTFVVDIRVVEITGAQARVRVNASRTRLFMRNGTATTERRTFLNSQLWRREPAGWKLLRDGPFADELADDIIAAAPADRPAMYEKMSRPDLVQARLAVATRATMAVTVGGKDYPHAKELFAIALDMARAGGDRHGEASALHNIAQADYFLHNYPAAIEAYEKELDIGKAIDDEGAVAAASFGLAAIAYAQAEYTHALELYRDALAVYEKLDDNSSMGRTLVSIGNVQYLQADYDAALASYRRGLTVLVAGGDASGAAYARKGLARVLAAQGDVAAALDIYNQVLADARAALQADPRLTSDVSATLESIGELYFRVGNTDQARGSFEEAKRLVDKDPESSGRVLAALGMTELVAGRFDAAFAAYSDSRTRFDAAKQPEGVARAWVGIGFSQTARDKFDDAITAYQTAIGLFEQQSNNDGIARAWLGLSMAQSGAGNHAAALESAGKVTTIADRLKSDDLAWRGAERAGDALRKLDKLDEARQAFERATAAIDRLAADAPTSGEARGALSDSAGAWAGLALTWAKRGDAAAALAAMEARRAHIRRVDFAAFQHDIAGGATADERSDEQAIVREIVATRMQISAEAHAAKRDPARAERLGQQLTALTAKRADQQATLYARLPELARWRGLPQPPLDSAAIADLVPAGNGLLVAYLVTDDELLIVTVARGENGPDIAAQAAPLDRRAFADALAAAMQPSALQDIAEWRKRAAPLATALIDPIASRLAGRDRVLVIPDDLLWKVPFEALPGVDAAATVTYGTSLATLALERRISALPAEQRTAAVLAAPAIADAVRAQMTLILPSWKAPDAAASLTAAQAAASPYGERATLRSAAEASESAARMLAANADVLHVQAPLQVSGTTPLLSSILLASTGETPPEDGRFEVREWFAISGRARVIVLPDGATFGAAGVGSAMDAMAWAAAAAGASTVLFARWPADAFRPDALAAAFHAKIAAGGSPLEAWRAAVTAARVAPDGPAPPSAWAGLRFVGGGS